jgi:hypothetical protein
MDRHKSECFLESFNLKNSVDFIFNFLGELGVDLYRKLPNIKKPIVGAENVMQILNQINEKLRLHPVLA